MFVAEVKISVIKSNDYTRYWYGQKPCVCSQRQCRSLCTLGLFPCLDFSLGGFQESPQCLLSLSLTLNHTPGFGSQTGPGLPTNISRCLAHVLARPHICPLDLPPVTWTLCENLWSHCPLTHREEHKLKGPSHLLQWQLDKQHSSGPEEVAGPPLTSW